MDPIIIKIISKCKKDPAFFIDNFCCVKHPKLGIIPFKLFSYQKRCLKEFRNHRFSIFRKCRQCGISTLTGAYALWFAMFKSEKTILIMSKRDDDAKEYLSRNIKFAYQNLPEWMRRLWTPSVVNEHTLAFTNGSTIRSLTSSPDTLRSNASSLNIIDEAAFIDKMELVWAGGYSCVNPESIVSCNGATLQIGSLGNIDGDKWQDIDINIQSDMGIEHSDKFYVNGVADTKIVTTSLGYELECTENHRLKDENYNWIYAKEIKPGQKLALRCGSDFNADILDDSKTISNELAEDIGFQIERKLKTDINIPDVIMNSSIDARIHFLKGLFKINGFNFSSISEKLVKQVQVMLLNFGIITNRKIDHGLWSLSVSNEDRAKFIRLIDFKQFGSNSIFYDIVKSVKSSRSLTVDISVPSNNTYVVNGFVSHNTLQHGGEVIVVSTPKGIGNWYWKTWADAIDKNNDFNPIIINWWDMDWELKFKDEMSGVETVIAPTKGLRVVEDLKEIEKYGPGPNGKTFWSPWLEGEYRNLSTKGDDSRFRQEVLAEFIGSGNTVLNRTALNIVDRMTDSKYLTINRVDYVNPSINEHTILDFQDLLWVWEKPYTQRDANRAIEEAKKKGINPDSLSCEISKPHNYVIGADPSSGEANDFCAIQVLDITTQKQVAELKIKALPKVFAKMIDYIGRMYNTAHVVCERTGIGQAVTQELDKDLMYPNLYRHSRVTSTLKVKYSQIGYPTSSSTKPVLIKHLLDNIGEDGYHINSTRLYHEFCIFIHLGNGKYGNEPGTGNTDDLVLATCLALVGIQSALMRSGGALIPVHNMDFGSEGLTTVKSKSESKSKLNEKGVIAPIGISSQMYTNKINTADELSKFTAQLGGIPLNQNNITKQKTDSVTSKKHILKYFRG